MKIVILITLKNQSTLLLQLTVLLPSAPAIMVAYLSVQIITAAMLI